jgi:conjugal transfer pilus assembly protein TraK
MTPIRYKALALVIMAAVSGYAVAEPDVTPAASQPQTQPAATNDKAVVDNFQLPVQTTNARLTDIESSQDAATQSNINNPFQEVFNQLKSVIPKGGRQDYSSYGMPAAGANPAKAETPKPFEDILKSTYKPVQQYNLKPGENIAIAVAAGLMNRIKTNFQRVAVRTADEEAILEASDGYVYLTTNKLTPLGLIIYEEGMPETAVSLVLQPDNTPPAMVSVNVALTPEQQAKMADNERERERQKDIEMLSQVSEKKDGSQSHIERIKEMLMPIAKGGIPNGFTETQDIPTVFEQPCSVAIKQKTAQRFAGARELIDVVVMYNQTNYAYQIKEEQCLSRDALAVALMDQSILQPGASTEVYIVRDKLYQEKQADKNKRRMLTPEELGLTR